jgi:hypothetical protein
MKLSGLSVEDRKAHQLRADQVAFRRPSGQHQAFAQGQEQRLARHGRPKQTWPIVQSSMRSHGLRNPYAQQSMACRQLADSAVFAIYMSATAGQSPHELSYLGRLLGHATVAQPIRLLTSEF